MSIPYRICANGVQTTTDVTLTEISGVLTERTQNDDYDRVRTYKRYRFQSTVPADDNIRLYYSYEYRYSYVLGGITNEDWILNRNGSLLLLAGETQLDVEFTLTDEWCWFGEDYNEGVIKEYETVR